MRHLLCCVAVLALAAAAGAEDKKPEDTPNAAKTRKLLKTKISVDWKNTRFAAMMEELKDEVKGLSIRWDTKGGVSNNKTFTYKAKDKTVEEILNDVCKEAGDLGWYVISKKGNAYDGGVYVRKSDERGYEKQK
jgi:hypothetical protein